MIFPIAFCLLVLLFALIARRDLRLALFVIAATLPTYLLRLNISGVPVTLLECFILTAGIIWFVRNRKQSSLGFVHAWTFPILLLLTSATISVFVSPDLTAALGVWKAYFIEPILLFLLVRATLRDFDDAEQLLLWLGGGVLFVSLIAIAQSIFSIGIPEPWDVERRVTGVFPYPNALGLYVGPIIVLGIGAWYRSVRAEFFLRSWFWTITLACSITAMILSQTEAAWVAIPAALVLVGLTSSTLRWLAIPVATLAVIILLAFPAVQSKLLLHDYSGEVRRKQWEESIAMLTDRPILGAGLSGYPTALEEYHTHPEIEIFQYPHNLFLNIWSELGILGLLAVLALTVTVIQTYRNGLLSESPFTWLVLAAFAALMEMTIHGLVDVPYFKNDLAALTWIILALLSWAATGPYVEPIQPKSKTA